MQKKTSKAKRKQTKNPKQQQPKKTPKIPPWKLTFSFIHVFFNLLFKPFLCSGILHKVEKLGSKQTLKPNVVVQLWNRCPLKVNYSQHLCSLNIFPLLLTIAAFWKIKIIQCYTCVFSLRLFDFILSLLAMSFLFC